MRIYFFIITTNFEKDFKNFVEIITINFCLEDICSIVVIGIFEKEIEDFRIKITIANFCFEDTCFATIIIVDIVDKFFVNQNLNNRFVFLVIFFQISC